MILELHDTHFDKEAPDDEWIPAVTKHSWVIISADKRIDKDHLQCILESPCRIVLLTDNTSGVPQWTAAIIRCLEEIVQHMRFCQRPTIMRIEKGGIVGLIRGPEELKERFGKIETARFVHLTSRGVVRNYNRDREYVAMKTVLIDQQQETPWQRVDRAFRTVLKVSKEDFVKAEQAVTPAKKPHKKSATKTRPQ